MKDLKDFSMLLEGETLGGFEVYLVDPSTSKPFTKETLLSSALYRELGRVRERTFREVGEGTGNSLDLDTSIDSQFCQIILWDPKEKQIVGGYRAGIGSTMELTDLYNLKVGFRFSRSFRRHLKKGVEFGRSFVQEQYQSQAGFHSLWQGLHRFLKHLQTTTFPDVRYMFGGISIGADIPHSFCDRIIYLFQKTFPGLNFRFHKPIITAEDNLYSFKSPEEELRDYFRVGDNLDDRRAFVRRSLKLMKDMRREGLKFPVLFSSYADLCGVEGSFFSIAVKNQDRAGALEVAFMNDLYYLNPGQDRNFTGKDGYSILSHVRRQYNYDKAV